MNAQSKGRSWRQRVVAVFTERLGYKAVALFLTLALWLYIRTALR